MPETQHKDSDGKERSSTAGIVTVVIFIQRDEATLTSTIGRFVMFKHRSGHARAPVNGFMLEPASAELRPDLRHPCIPAGRYKAFARVSRRKGKAAHGNRVFQLKNVPGRSAIQIHVGNYPRDTEGCILPGHSKSPNMVRGSTVTMTRMWRCYDKVEAEAKKNGRQVEIEVIVADSPGSKAKRK